jgi:hypothetical protein
MPLAKPSDWPLQRPSRQFAILCWRREGVCPHAGTCTDLARARAVRVAKANQRASDLAPTILHIRAEGARSLRSLEGFPADLNRWDSQGVRCERFFWH